MQRILRFGRMCPLVPVLFFLFSSMPPYDLNRLSRSARLDYLRKADIWQKRDVRSADLFSGPENAIAVPPESEVECHYVEETQSVGHTPKFKCKLLDNGEIVRIKFSRRETYAEVAGTRLLWALGFYADQSYPVKLRCYGCPQFDPSQPGDAEKRMERVLPDAVMERNFDGKEIAQFEDQGWRWSELRDVNQSSGGASKAEIDALKLLAVFLQHNDSKPSQQRLACYDKDLRWQQGNETCAKPVLMIQDVGATFGAGDRVIGAFSAMYYKGWERMNIWNEAKEIEVEQNTGRRACFGQLESAFTNGLIHPEISEEGRQFLADLLNQLSDDQIRDLFRAARADEIEETIVQEGRETRVTIEHWLAVFKKKRDQINARRCVSSS